MHKCECEYNQVNFVCSDRYREWISVNNNNRSMNTPHFEDAMNQNCLHKQLNERDSKRELIERFLVRVWSLKSIHDDGCYFDLLLDCGILGCL